MAGATSNVKKKEKKLDSGVVHFQVDNSYT
jgi:hypothetical protein